MSTNDLDTWEGEGGALPFDPCWNLDLGLVAVDQRRWEREGVYSNAPTSAARISPQMMRGVCDYIEAERAKYSSRWQR